MPRGDQAFLDHWRLVRPYADDLCTVVADDEKWYVVDDGVLGIPQRHRQWSSPVDGGPPGSDLRGPDN